MRLYQVSESSKFKQWPALALPTSKMTEIFPAAYIEQNRFSEEQLHCILLTFEKKGRKSIR